MTIDKSFCAMVLALQFVGPTMAPGQPALTLEAEVERAREAWLEHDVRSLVARSDTVRLQLPGIGRAPSARPQQAALVLRDYMRSANEITFELRSIRLVNEEHAYAEMVRVYVVQGTADQRVETVFLGFRRVSGQWSLREIRITA